MKFKREKSEKKKKGIPWINTKRSEWQKTTPHTHEAIKEKKRVKSIYKWPQLTISPIVFTLNWMPKMKGILLTYLPHVASCDQEVSDPHPVLLYLFNLLSLSLELNLNCSTATFCTVNIILVTLWLFLPLLVEHFKDTRLWRPFC